MLSDLIESEKLSGEAVARNTQVLRMIFDLEDQRIIGLINESIESDAAKFSILINIYKDQGLLKVVLDSNIAVDENDLFRWIATTKGLFDTERIMEIVISVRKPDEPAAGLNFIRYADDIDGSLTDAARDAVKYFIAKGAEVEKAERAVLEKELAELEQLNEEVSRLEQEQVEVIKGILALTIVDRFDNVWIDKSGIIFTTLTDLLESGELSGAVVARNIEALNIIFNAEDNAFIIEQLNKGISSDSDKFSILAEVSQDPNVLNLVLSSDIAVYENDLFKWVATAEGLRQQDIIAIVKSVEGLRDNLRSEQRFLKYMKETKDIFLTTEAERAVQQLNYESSQINPHLDGIGREFFSADDMTDKNRITMIKTLGLNSYDVTALYERGFISRDVIVNGFEEGKLNKEIFTYWVGSLDTNNLVFILRNITLEGRDIMLKEVAKRGDEACFALLEDTLWQREPRAIGTKLSTESMLKAFLNADEKPLYTINMMIDKKLISYKDIKGLGGGDIIPKLLHERLIVEGSLLYYKPNNNFTDSIRLLSESEFTSKERHQIIGEIYADEIWKEWAYIIDDNEKSETSSQIKFEAIPVNYQWDVIKDVYKKYLEIDERASLSYLIIQLYESDLIKSETIVRGLRIGALDEVSIQYFLDKNVFNGDNVILVGDGNNGHVTVSRIIRYVNDGRISVLGLKSFVDSGLISQEQVFSEYNNLNVRIREQILEDEIFEPSSYEITPREQIEYTDVINGLVDLDDGLEFVINEYIEAINPGPDYMLMITGNPTLTDAEFKIILEKHLISHDSTLVMGVIRTKEFVSSEVAKVAYEEDYIDKEQFRTLISEKKFRGEAIRYALDKEIVTKEELWDWFKRDNLDLTSETVDVLVDRVFPEIEFSNKDKEFLRDIFINNELSGEYLDSGKFDRYVLDHVYGEMPPSADVLYSRIATDVIRFDRGVRGEIVKTRIELYELNIDQEKVNNILARLDSNYLIGDEDIRAIYPNDMERTGEIINLAENLRKNAIVLNAFKKYGAIFLGVSAAVAAVAAVYTIVTQLANENGDESEKDDMSMEEFTTISNIIKIVEDNEDAINDKLNEYQNMDTDEFADLRAQIDPQFSQLTLEILLDLPLNEQIECIALLAVENKDFTLMQKIASIVDENQEAIREKINEYRNMDADEFSDLQIQVESQLEELTYDDFLNLSQEDQIAYSAMEQIVIDNDGLTIDDLDILRETISNNLDDDPDVPEQSSDQYIIEEAITDVYQAISYSSPQFADELMTVFKHELAQDKGSNAYSAEEWQVLMAAQAIISEGELNGEVVGEADYAVISEGLAAGDDPFSITVSLMLEGISVDAVNQATALSSYPETTIKKLAGDSAGSAYNIATANSYYGGIEQLIGNFLAAYIADIADIDDADEILIRLATAREVLD